jgi:hypothetical protein
MDPLFVLRCFITLLRKDRPCIVHLINEWAVWRKKFAAIAAKTISRAARTQVIPVNDR